MIDPHGHTDPCLHKCKDILARLDATAWCPSPIPLPPMRLYLGMPLKHTAPFFACGWSVILVLGRMGDQTQCLCPFSFTLGVEPPSKAAFPVPCGPHSWQSFELAHMVFLLGVHPSIWLILPVVFTRLKDETMHV